MGGTKVRLREEFSRMTRAHLFLCDRSHVRAERQPAGPPRGTDSKHVTTAGALVRLARSAEASGVASRVWGGGCLAPCRARSGMAGPAGLPLR